MIKRTEDKELWELIQQGLSKKKEKYGKRYCPCSFINDEDHICMCKEFRDAPIGSTCHCRIYTKIADS